MAEDKATTVAKECYDECGGYTDEAVEETRKRLVPDDEYDRLSDTAQRLIDSACAQLVREQQHQERRRLERQIIDNQRRREIVVNEPFSKAEQKRITASTRAAILDLPLIYRGSKKLGDYTRAEIVPVCDFYFKMGQKCMMWYRFLQLILAELKNDSDIVRDRLTDNRVKELEDIAADRKRPGKDNVA